MTERPILFSAPMVCALLAGTKTQTRRVVKLRVGEVLCSRDRALAATQDRLINCPYGQPDDRLWVRESLRFVKVGENLHEHAVYAADGVRVPRCPDLAEWCCDGLAFGLAKSVPSIHMPRWASRITLEVTGVRVERLQDISIEDAKAEGAWGPDDSIVSKVAEYFHVDILAANPLLAYRMLWEQINGPGSWAANPWVWVVEFRRMT